jgi:hypothetical protein
LRLDHDREQRAAAPVLDDRDGIGEELGGDDGADVGRDQVRGGGALDRLPGDLADDVDDQCRAVPDQLDRRLMLD